MPAHSKSEPPEPVPLGEWRDQISIALLFKSNKQPPPEHLERAVENAYAAKCTFVELLEKTKSDSRPSEIKRGQLKKSIKELEDCIRIMEQHLFAQPAPGINPSFPSPGNGGLTLNARIAWRDHKIGDLDKIRPVLEQFFENVSDSPPSYEGMAHHVKESLQILEALKARYVHARANKGYDHFGIDMWVSAAQAKRLNVTHLMNIFCRLRGENIQEVPIGNPDYNTNPLLRFLNAASAPIAGKRKLDIGWIPPSSLVSTATRVKKSAKVG